MDKNISEAFIRTAMLLGTEAEEKLQASKVAVYGAGGVGGHCIEALARCGIGRIHITDNDTVRISNLNRQCAATKPYIGKPKTEAMRHRIEETANTSVTTAELFVLPENINQAVPDDVDFIVDAVDTITAKLALVKYSFEHSIPIVSCMGMGNRLDPTQVRIGDLFSVTGCPLARVMRRELRKCGIYSLPVVYSLEPPLVPIPLEKSTKPGKQTPGSSAFVPAAGGLAMAYYVVKHICDK